MSRNELVKSIPREPEPCFGCRRHGKLNLCNKTCILSIEPISKPLNGGKVTSKNFEKVNIE